MNKIYRFILSGFIITGAVSSLFSQIVGNPIGSAGAGAWTMSLSGSFFRQAVATEMAYSNRIMLKSNHGIAPWLDFYGMIGAADLQLDARHVNVSDFRDHHSFAYGLGMMLTPLRETQDNPYGIFLGGNIFRFHPDGEFNETVLLPSGELAVKKQYIVGYDWRELTGFGGASYSLNRMRLYLGGVVSMISRLDKKTEYWHFMDADAPEFIGTVESELQSDLWTGAVAGLEFRFPKEGYSLTLEGIFYNTQYFRLMVGVSQTGTPMGDW